MKADKIYIYHWKNGNQFIYVLINNLLFFYSHNLDIINKNTNY